MKDTHSVFNYTYTGKTAQLENTNRKREKSDRQGSVFAFLLVAYGLLTLLTDAIYCIFGGTNLLPMAMISGAPGFLILALLWPLYLRSKKEDEQTTT